MKKILFVLVVALITTTIQEKTEAQVSVNFNIGVQPLWGPVGYDYAEYYYLPDIQAYYWVPRHQFVYLSSGRWIFSASLPFAYRDYDLFSGYKVVINEPRAYLHFNDHRMRYEGFRGNRTQMVIRNSNEPKYFAVKGHPHYGERQNEHVNTNYHPNSNYHQNTNYHQKEGRHERRR